MSAVLITGAAHRIGRGLAQAFAEAGFAVALHYHRSAAAARALADQLPTKSCLIKADLETLDLAHADRLLKQAADGLGEDIDCLINNAAIFEPDRAGAIDEKLWQAHLDINLRAPIFLTRALARHQTQAGNVIMLIDEKVLRPTPDFFSYTVAKMALWGATQLMAQTFAPHIRVNAIGPGPILPSAHQTQAAFADSQRATLLKRSARVEEIAEAALFLASQPAITGQLIALDGGQHIQFDA